LLQDANSGRQYGEVKWLEEHQFPSGDLMTSQTFGAARCIDHLQIRQPLPSLGCRHEPVIAGAEIQVGDEDHDTVSLSLQQGECVFCVAWQTARQLKQ
jgi:hypothetical protein